jgi:hypothetical protein
MAFVGSVSNTTATACYKPNLGECMSSKRIFAGAGGWLPCPCYRIKNPFLLNLSFFSKPTPGLSVLPYIE